MFFDRPYSSPFSGGVNNPPTSGDRTVQYSPVADARQRRPDDGRRARTDAFPTNIEAADVDAVERRRADDAAVGDGARRVLRRPARLQPLQRREHQRGRLRRLRSCRELRTGRRRRRSSVEHAAAEQPARDQGLRRGSRSSRTAAGGPTTRIQLSLNRRFQNGVSFGFYDTIGLSDRQQPARACSTTPTARYSFRADQARGRRAARQQQPGA